MAQTKEELMKKNRTELVNMLMTNELQLDSIRNELQTLKNEVKSNNELRERITILERNSYAMQQYSRRDSVEFNGIPECVSDDQLEVKVIDLLGKIGIDVEPSNIHACHRLYNKNRTIVKFVNRKHAFQSRRNQFKLKNLDKTTVGLPRQCQIYINESLCPYYGMLLGKCKQLYNLKIIHSYWIINGTIRYKMTEDGSWSNVGHLDDLTERFPQVDFISKDFHN